MRLGSVAGIVPVPLDSVDSTAAALAARIVAARGPESAHDPGVAQAALDAAELAHDQGAGLVAVAEHPSADPGILIGMVVTADVPLGEDAAAQVRRLMTDSAGSEIREVTESRTGRGYPVVIAERMLVGSGERAACQVQAVVVDPGGRRLAVLTLHSITGRGWLELAALLGRLVSTVDFGARVPGQPPAVPSTLSR